MESKSSGKANHGLSKLSLTIGDAVTLWNGTIGTIDQIEDDFVHVVFDKPIESHLGKITGGWYVWEKVTKSDAKTA